MTNLANLGSVESPSLSVQRLFPRNATPLIDLLTAKPACAFDFFYQLKLTQTSPWLAYRADAAELAMRFRDGSLDVEYLANWAGSQSVYVKTWYDAMASGVNPTQSDSTKMPLAWSGTTRDFPAYSRLSNGIAAPLFTTDGVNDYLLHTGAIGISGNPNLSIAMVAANATDNGHFCAIGDTAIGADKVLAVFREAAATNALVGQNSTGYVDRAATALGTPARHMITRESGADSNATVWRQSGAALALTDSAADTPNLEDDGLSVASHTNVGGYGALKMGHLAVFAHNYSHAGNATDLATWEAWALKAYPGIL